MKSAFQMPSPVLLSSQVDVALRNNASPNMSELSYPYRKAVLIDEIRVDLWATNDEPINLGALVYAKFYLGQHYLMKDPVPVWLLGTMMDLFEEEQVDSFLSTGQIFSHYRWKLPEPLYVEAGQALRPVFNRVPIVTSAPSGNITVQVSYAGRVMPPNAPRPDKIVIPYAAAFVTTFGNTYEQSNEYHLFNPFFKPMHVQRLTGRLFDNDGPGVNQPRPTSVAGLTPVTAGGNITVQIDDSWGGKMVPDRTGPADVFDALRGGWTVDTVMPAKGQYNIRAWNIGSLQQLHVALIGSREEAI